jgi:hypothetical protein
MIYNKNIQIIDENPSIKTDLKYNEYFALMVMDLDTPTDDRDWFNAEKKYVGLSRCSNGDIYISKDWRKTDDKWRGKSVLVSVQRPFECYEL